MPTDNQPIDVPADESLRRADAAISTELTPSRRGTTAAGLVTIGLLLAITLSLVFQGGAYGPSTWLPLMVAVGALALTLALAGPAVSSSRLQKALLAIFALQAVWTAASVLWAGSQANAWEEANRTLFYLVIICLAFVAIRWSDVLGLKALALAVALTAAVAGVSVLITLAVSSDASALFLADRLNWPITYFNGLAALLMMGFWLVLGMANGARCIAKAKVDLQADADLQAKAGPSPSADDTEDTQERVVSRVAWRRSQSVAGERFPRWTQPLLVVLAVVLVEVALLPQSRGALWTFFLVVPFFLILSPHRFRALVDLALVAAPVVLFWDDLNAPYMALSGGTSLSDAIFTFLMAVGYSVAIVLGIWALTWLVEHRVGPLRRKATVWISVGLASLAIFGAAATIVYADVRTGGLDDYLTDRWQEVTNDSSPSGEGSTRFSGVGLNGRWRTWQIAAEAFENNPALGLGAQNFEDYFYQHRPAAFNLRQPHSQPMQLLAELGLPGALLWLAFIAVVLVRAAVVRFRSTEWSRQVVLAAMTAATLSWFIHSSADWLWQLAGVTLPAMMLLGGLIAADASAPDGVADARPSPPLRRSRLLRVLVALLALGAIASAAFPYLSQRYSALAAGAGDPAQAEARAATAAWLDPTSPEPYTSLAVVYPAAAASPTSPEERLAQLRLAADAWQQALQLEPYDWIYPYQIADSLLLARDAAREGGDFSTAQELATEARSYLDEARRLNPLSPEVRALEERL